MLLPENLILPNIPIKVGVVISPLEADVAIITICTLPTKTPGALDVLRAYEYSLEVVDTLSASQLSLGFGVIPNNQKQKPIIYISLPQIREGQSKNDFDNDFRFYFNNALKHNLNLLIGKRIWIPLIGVEEGGLSFDKSYIMVTSCLRDFYRTYLEETNTEFLISFPDNELGRGIYKAINNINKPNHIWSLIRQIKGGFFLLDSDWGYENDQTEFFIENNSWEHKDKSSNYSTLINSVKKNDIVILKSNDYVRVEPKEFLRIKAIGVVKDNPRNGKGFKVDWNISKLNVDVKMPKEYLDGIVSINRNTVKALFSHIDYSILKNWLENYNVKQPLGNTKIINSPAKIPRLNNDSEIGEDYLDIIKDVTAFARVIASQNFEPPLAIALLGKWGSGKSFFMHKLRETINDLSSRNTLNMYCKGVVHIHFNAWAYMDSNLWASFVSKIFEGLKVYIKDNTLANVRKDEVEKELTNKLSLTKESIANLSDKKKSLGTQIESLGKKKTNLEDKLEKKYYELKSKTLILAIEEFDKTYNIQEKITEALRNNPTFLNTKEKLEAIIPKKYWNNPKEIYAEVKSIGTFWKILSKFSILGIIFWLTLIILCISLLPKFLMFFAEGLKDFGFILPPQISGWSSIIFLFFGRVVSTYKKWKPLVKNFWRIKENYDYEKEMITSEFYQNQKLLELEIQQQQQEILFIEDQIQDAKLKEAELQYKVSNGLNTETLFRFIEDRSKSDDYRKYLGIISTIRKDFEILSELFLGHRNEFVDQNEVEEFKKHFNKPIERIVLYIDDLDRCTEENVVQVLEAINLLMAFPLFVVVVGVDPRWVNNALMKKYNLQLNDQQNTFDSVNYLEKIFQVPFCLNHAQSINVKSMIKELTKTTSSFTPRQKDNVNQEKAMNKAEEQYLEYLLDPEIEKLNGSIKHEFNEHLSITDELEISVTEEIEFLQLTNEEIETMTAMSAMLESTPRQIKRFVNIYKIIKAHHDSETQMDTKEDEVFAPIFILALTIGKFRPLLRILESTINDHRLLEKPLRVFFNTSIEEDVSDSFTLIDVLKDTLEENNIFEKVNELSFESLNKYFPFVTRFFFNLN